MRYQQQQTTESTFSSRRPPFFLCFCVAITNQGRRRRLFFCSFFSAYAYHSENQSSVSPQNLLMSYVGLSPRSALTHRPSFSSQQKKSASSHFVRLLLLIFLSQSTVQPSMLLMISTYVHICLGLGISFTLSFTLAKKSLQFCWIEDGKPPTYQTLL
jgi:flagellar biosynthesis protein FliP